MAFKELADMDCDSTTALGGFNKKTGKPNPTKAEGYLIGSKDVPSTKSKTGFAKLHIIQTAKGNLGIWGKTDLDRKMLAVEPGCMIRITQNGTVPTGKGNDMYKFKVEVDEENRIEVAGAPSGDAPESDPSQDDVDMPQEPAEEEQAEETPLDEDEQQPDVVPPTRPAAPARRAAAAPSATSQAKVQELLNKRRAAK